MSETKFTPGPWNLDSFGFGLHDKHLAAAAPDLYAALEALLKEPLEHFEVVAAEAALAKARGEQP